MNDDGTITIPLRGQPPVTIAEPSMGELAWLTDEVDRIDASLPQLPSIQLDEAGRARGTTEEIAAFNEAVAERTKAIYSGEMPYGRLLIEMVKRFSDGAVIVGENDLPSWAASPTVMRKMLETFRSPLPGEA